MFDENICGLTSMWGRQQYGHTHILLNLTGHQIAIRHGLDIEACKY